MLKKNTLTPILAIVLLLIWGCHQPKVKSAANELMVHRLQNALHIAVIHDGFSPPVASRIYAYTSIAAYEGIRLNDTFPTLSGTLNGFHLTLPNVKSEEINNKAVMVAAFCKVAATLVYRGYYIDSIRNECWTELKDESSKEVLAKSEQVGLNIAHQILQWAGKDMYKETRDMPKFRPTGADGHWAPTGPTFADALEPYWKLMRPFVLDSANQFKIPSPPPFSKDKNSDLYKYALEVMNDVDQIDSFWRSTVEYWDCNPQRTHVNGHIMYTERKITPGGHWMSIAQNICKQKKLDNVHSAHVFALVSIALADGFIAAWEEKYRTDFIRPETYIQNYINKSWQPLIETPTFPEYASAHSTVSASAATVLERLFGSNISFVDSTEITFKMLPRKFSSFREAADEAAASRVHAGIHFTPGCINGKMLGNKVGELVIEKLTKN